MVRLTIRFTEDEWDQLGRKAESRPLITFDREKLPETAQSAGLNDVAFENREIVRSFLHILQVFVHFWSANGIAKYVRDVACV